MKIIPMLLALIGFFTFTFGFVDGAEVHLRNTISKFRNASAGKSKIPDGVQIAGFYDPTETATNEAWDKYKDKGSYLSCLLDANDEDVGKAWPNYLNRNPPSASSEWQGTLENQLKQWAWRENPYNQDEVCDFSGQFGRNNAKTAMQALKINTFPATKGGDNVCYAVDHFSQEEFERCMDDDEEYEEYYEVNGRKYRLTGASYCFGINHKGGALIANNILSPSQAADEYWVGNEGETDASIPESELPALRRVSDIMAAYWLQGNANAKGLKYYFALDIRNEDTLPIITWVLKRKTGKTLVPTWPGVKVGMWEEEGEVLLGSPMGATLAYLLLQHKASLGTKHVTEITIFRADDAGGEIKQSIEVHMVFKIEDVPQPGKPKDDKDEDTEMRDVDDKPRLRRGRGLGNGVVKREYFSKEGMRVHEFRMGQTVEAGDLD